MNAALFRLPTAADSGVSGELLRDVAAAVRLGLMEFWSDSLELRSFEAPADAADPFGLKPAQVAVGARWSDNIYPSDRARLAAHLAVPDQAAPAPAVDYRLIVGEGELLWVRHWTLLRAHAGPRRWVRSVIMPIPEQKHLEWECLRVSERECNRIGQELHDDLCQVLAGLVFMMRVVGQRARNLDAGLSDEIEELSTHLVATNERVRSMAHGLFPAQLNFASLGDALASFAAEARTLFRIECSLKLPAAIPRHSPEQIIQVYRITQEAVSNAVRHGRATAVTVSLAAGPGGLTLRIVDNGRGFPAASGRPEGIGIHVMQYRARMLGGRFDLRPHASGGVVAELAYPIATSTFPSPRQPDVTP